MVRIRRQLELLASIVSLLGLLPAWAGLDTLAQVATPMALLGGLWGDRRARPLLGPRLATAISLLVFVGYAWQIDRQNLVDPVLNMVVLLLGVRLLTAKQGRHFLQIFLLAGFALAGSTLVSLSLLFLPAMVLLVCGITYGLVLLCYLQADPQLRLERRPYAILLRTTLLLPAGSLLLSLLFFFILPRTEHPLWNFLNPASLTGGVGFADEVRPGSVSETAADSRIAFRAEAPELAPEDLYWRGTVLETLVDSTWSRTELAETGPPLVEGGRTLEVTLFPAVDTGRVLITLDVPTVLQRKARTSVRRDGVYTLPGNEKRPRSYTVRSSVGGRLREPESTRGNWLDLPPSIAPRGRARVAQLVPADGDRQNRITAVQSFFRAQQLTYATQNLPVGGDPVDTFLFESKRGYCEHFASAFAVLLRAAGVPSRLVGGYYGGDYNPLGGYYLVGERSAHVWVEALLDDGRWQRYDPNQLAARFESGLLAGHNPLPQWRQLADAIDYYWVQAVVTLDFARQLEAAVALRNTWHQQRDRWGRHGIGLLSIAATAVGAWWWYRRKRRPAQVTGDRLVRVFVARVERRLGRPRRIDEGLLTLAEASGSEAAGEFARIYGLALYGGRPLSGEERRRLRELLLLLRQPPKPELSETRSGRTNRRR